MERENFLRLEDAVADTDAGGAFSLLEIFWVSGDELQGGGRYGLEFFKIVERGDFIDFAAAVRAEVGGIFVVGGGDFFSEPEAVVEENSGLQIAVEKVIRAVVVDVANHGVNGGGQIFIADEDGQILRVKIELGAVGERNFQLNLREAVAVEKNPAAVNLAVEKIRISGLVVDGNFNVSDTGEIQRESVSQIVVEAVGFVD